MKFLLFDESAIISFVSINSLQSIEYDQASVFVQHLRGMLQSGLFENVIVHYYDDGIIFSGKTLASDATRNGRKRIFCIDLGSCNILVENDSSLLTIVQKTFRTVLKIWNRLPFGSSERIHGSKSIVFPFVFPDKRRIVIERSSSVLQVQLQSRGIEYPLLAYKYNAEDPPQREEEVDSRVLKAAGRLYNSEYYTLQHELDQRMPKEENLEEGKAFQSVDAVDHVGRGDFAYIGFERQYERLTRSQKDVVDYESINTPLRVVGAAGTGKTLSLIMRAYKLLREYKEKKEPYRIVFFAHSQSTQKRNLDTFRLYPDSAQFLQEEAPQSIVFTTLLDYCIRKARIATSQLPERDASDLKVHQLLLIEMIVQEAFENHTIRTNKPLLSEEMREVLDPERTAITALYSMLHHEFSVQIKGRTDCTFEEYEKLPSLPNGLPCQNKKDKEFVFSLFMNYQALLDLPNEFDIDDVTMEAMARLNAPVWRRERVKNGYDYIIVDEMHLFNINEQSIFHFLTKDTTLKNIPICFALDYGQAIGDLGDTSKEYSEKAFGALESRRYQTVFRSSPQITDFCASIAASGTLMFQGAFSNPYQETTSDYTEGEEKKCALPSLYMYSNDEEMLFSIGNHIDNLQRDLHCNPTEIAVISFDDSLLSELGLNKITTVTGKEFALLRSREDVVSKNHFVLVSPYDVNGLEFQAVILYGVDEGRVPQIMGTSDISQHYIRYTAFNLLYLTSSRAKYRLILLGSNLNGISSCLEHSIEAGYLSSETDRH